MDIRGKAALVTGANRGLGRVFAQALLDAGAGRVYAGARDPSGIDDPHLVPLRLDVTSARDIAAAAEACADVEILINNAGAMFATPVLAPNSDDVLRREMEVNVFGTLAMAKAFAPVLARNGGGALVNMLSVVSWYVYPFNGTYGATKHAALAITDGLRIQLRAQGTRVIAVYAGLIDTDMGAALSSGPKTSPQQVAAKTIEGIRTGQEHVIADDSAASLWQATRQDLIKKHADMQARWDQHMAAARTQG
ncbi:MAG TPA: SDR family oxidoreductase [Alphaproteobacteria bacterium]|nr:SDR family oxidoreductase [Alphaproteobacteria bacterium]